MKSSRVSSRNIDSIAVPVGIEEHKMKADCGILVSLHQSICHLLEYSIPSEAVMTHLTTSLLSLPTFMAQLADPAANTKTVLVCLRALSPDTNQLQPVMNSVLYRYMYTCCVGTMFTLGRDYS